MGNSKRWQCFGSPNQAVLKFFPTELSLCQKQAKIGEQTLKNKYFSGRALAWRRSKLPKSNDLDKNLECEIKQNWTSTIFYYLGIN